MLRLVWELWFGGSILQTQKQCLLMVVSMGSTAGNQCGMSWLMLESLLKLSLLQLEGRYLDTCSAEGSACCQHWLGTASQRKRSVVFSSYWITTMPDAERVCAFYKWRKKQYVLDHILNIDKNLWSVSSKPVQDQIHIDFIPTALGQLELFQFTLYENLAQAF